MIYNIYYICTCIKQIWIHNVYRHIFIHINVYIGANSRIDGQLYIHICHLNLKVDPSRGLVCLNMGLSENPYIQWFFSSFSLLKWQSWGNTRSLDAFKCWDSPVNIGDLTGRCENGLDAWHLKVGTLTPKWQFSWEKMETCQHEPWFSDFKTQPASSDWNLLFIQSSSQLDQSVCSHALQILFYMNRPMCRMDHNL